MDAIVRRFNARHGTNLSLRAGIDAGKVTSGLVGRSACCTTCGATRSTWRSASQGAVTQPGIFVTQRVYDRLRDATTFEPAGTIDTGDGTAAGVAAGGGRERPHVAVRGSSGRSCSSSGCRSC